VKALQDFVKSIIAPYKYLRRIEFVTTLPRDRKAAAFQVSRTGAGRHRRVNRN